MRSSNKDWDPPSVRKVSVFRPDQMATIVDSEKPFFEAVSGGIYAVATREGKPSHFLRVDKPKMPHKIRKALKRKAKALAVANS